MPHAHHVLGNWRHIRPELADGGLVHAFAGAGYHTLYTGKWHVPGTTPARFGFADTAAIPAVLLGRDRGRYIEPYREYARARGFRLLADNMENLTAGDAARLHRPGEAPCGGPRSPTRTSWRRGRRRASCSASSNARKGARSSPSAPSTPPTSR